MNVAFLVVAHDDLVGLRELCRELAPHRVVVHLDRPFHRELAHAGQLDSIGTHVRVLDDPECVHWGGFSVHRVMVRLLSAALEDPEVDFVAFLSGRCFPLRPVEDFVRFVEGAPFSVHCRAFPLREGDAFMGLDRVRRRHFLDGAIGHLRKRGGRGLGGPLRRVAGLLARPVRDAREDSMCGSQWIGLPRALAVELVSEDEQGAFAHLSNAWAPDEIAFHTHIFNSPWASRTQVGGPEHYEGRPLAHFSNFHWLRGSLQGSVTAEDLRTALASDRFFIRKMPDGEDGRERRQQVRANWGAAH
ncbi:beta-1,6-N-acetylglucosaminyltransferase [Nocardioides solisilvae]|uniref:beta-1,6-N-acetylglucosaminyltransferase n=1 Tax=Nocardioides solisilvae TaxID=1542435 RepID=UPI000D74207D|nr:beta-1,6-N-acetylglucosaminyltransferase [Nocardioides solisilvae]